MIVSERISRWLSWRTKTALALFAAIVTPLSLYGSPGEKTEDSVSHRHEPAASSTNGLPQDSKDEKAGGGPAAVAAPKETPAQDAQPAAEPSADRFTLHGRVLGPDGEPFAGAKIYAQTRYDSNIRRDSPARATTAKDGLSDSPCSGRSSVPYGMTGLFDTPR